MPDIATLGISLDTRQVADGSKVLDALGDTATRMEQKVAGATAAVDKLGEANATNKAKATEGAAAVESVGEASSRTAQKVSAASTSVDTLSASLERIKSTSSAGASGLDGFMNSTNAVWRSGDASKSVDAMGAAWRRTADYSTVNTSMKDTVQVMRQFDVAARANAQATMALGGATGQLTLGQQQLIERMREQAATIGMSRTQLLAYQAAQMGVTKETQDSIAKMKAYEDSIKAAAKAKDDAAKSSGFLADAVKGLVAAYAALKIADYVKESALLASRYETLGVVMEVVGRNAGYTKTQMLTATQAIAAQGITMVESRESAVKLVQAHVDLKNATVLARIAQDAAVIGHLNSSDAFDRLVNGISRGNVLILRNIGINVNLQSAYRQMADELGKTTKELTENERVQARLNAVIERGSDIAGTYTASMDTAGKQITSMQRYVTDLKTQFGETFNEVLTISVMALTRSLKDANGEVSALSKNNSLEEWGHGLASTFVWLANTVSNASTVLQKAWAWADLKTEQGRILDSYEDKIDANASDGSIGADERKRRYDRIKAQGASELAQSKAEYEVRQAQLTDGFDRFEKAEDARNAARTAKRKAEADAQLKVDTDYAKAASDILLQSANAGAAAQEVARKKVIDLYSKTYIGNPNYRDTESPEPKAKVDRAENTRLTAQIEAYERELSETKAHYAALGKLDDLYIKAGELSAGQAYENKRQYAQETYAAEVDAYQLELEALRSHKSATEAEEERHQKEIKAILGKLDAAEKAFFDERRLRDEEERLRKAGIVAASDEASGKYIFTLNQEAKKIEEANRAHGKAATFLEREEIARLDLAIAYQKQFMRGQEAAGATDEEIAQAPKILQFLEDQRAARARLANAADQQDIIAKNYEANKKMWESIDSTAHDTFVSIFDSGKSAFDRLRDTLKNGLLDLLYQMTIKKWIFNIGASVTGAGMGGVANAGDLASMGGAGGMAGGIGSTVGLINSAKNAYTIATQGFAGVTAGMGSGMVSLGTMFGSSALEAFGAGFGSTGMVAAGDAAGMYAASGAVGNAGAVTAGAYTGAAVTAAAGIAAGVLSGNMIAGQYGSSNNVKGGALAGAGIGWYFGGATGAAIGGFLGGAVGGIGNRLFGMGDKRYGDMGITGTLTGTGFSGEEYAKWTQKGGYFRSDKADTDRKAVDATTSNAFIDTYAAIRKVSATLAETLGVDTSSLATRSQALNINLTGLKTEAEKLEAVTKFFVGVGNDIAVELVPNIASFKIGTEELSTTLERVSHNYAGVDMVLQLIGRTSQEAFGSVGVASIGARENLVKLAGSLDALANGTTFFAENFLTEAERMKPVLSTVADTLAKLGMSGVKTAEDYKKVVLGLDLSSVAGQEMYIKLLALAPAFKAATDYTNQLNAATGNYAAVVKTAAEIASEHLDLQKQLNELTKNAAELLAIQRSSIADVNKALFDQVQAAKAVVSAKDALAKAYDAESTAAKAALDKSKSWVTTLNSLNPSFALGNQSTLTPEQKYAEARAQFEKTLAAANAGDTTAQSGLSAAEQAFLTASQVVNASDAKYAADYARVMAANDEALKWAGAQVDVQQASLDALKAQVSGLITINDSVLTVAQAIATLQAAMGVSDGLGVRFTNAPVFEAPVAPAAFDVMRYSAAANVGSDALVAEIRGLRDDNRAMRDELKGLREDQARQTGATIQANQEANASAADKVVSGVEKSAKASAWERKVEFSK
ncbi:MULTISPECIES: hypothetical protein [unclassified Janthinobacterium]|uniref:hypothetical protein n=1 Tax=unclassified Janthinobacterium TaxID=2610881 RepID=UPI0016119DDF|nr:MULTISPECIES: hypothetical protein [unclassified Janthinobacterium]MBB5610439.1 hypothetical protein [Janthinobacterium sp. S3T4]MBB5615724.1 hypothetical protein [Janthinobacterium sp. S3M3]